LFPRLLSNTTTLHLSVLNFIRHFRLYLRISANINSKSCLLSANSTRSSANAKTDTLAYPHLTPIPSACIHCLRSLINKLNKSGDTMHPCLRPNNTSKKSVQAPNKTLLSTLLYILLSTLHIFPCTPRFRLCHSPFLHTVS